MKADILACYDDTWVDKLIRVFTGEKVTHIAIEVFEGYLMETGWAGIKLCKIESKRGKFYRLRCDKLTDSAKDAIADFVIDKVDKPYDYKQLFLLGLYKLFGIKPSKDNPNKYICVELVVDAYASVGVNILPGYTEADLAIPSDLMHSDKLTLVV